MNLLRHVLSITMIVSIATFGWIEFYHPSGAFKVQPPPAAIQGFEIAQNCYPSHFELSDMSLYIVPGRSFKVLYSSDKLGYTLYHKIFIAQGSINDPKSWAHEFIHSFGVMGHPKDIFERCSL